MASAAATIKRVALVTGAAQGIGKSIAVRLAGDGLKVALNDITSKQEQLQQVVSEIKATGGNAIVVPADVSREDDVMAMTAQVVRELGGLDVVRHFCLAPLIDGIRDEILVLNQMVANAGVLGKYKPLVDTTIEEFEEIMSVDMRGVMLSYKYAALQMIKQGRGGRIIGATSMGGRRGYPNTSAYCAAKFGVRGLTHSAAKELAQYDITVNAYAPGIILTALNHYPEDVVNGGAGSTTMKVLGLPPHSPLDEPDVVASLVSYLAKPEASFITGQIVSIDGGIICT